jgi:hypothetical protein
MITALISSDGRIEPLAATLATLVPGVADGVIADAVVIGRKGDEEIKVVADGVGAGFCVVPTMDAVWTAGAHVARRDWVLCLLAGDVLLEGWIGALERFVVGAEAGRVGRMRRGSPILNFSAAAEALFGAAKVRPGDVLHRGLLRGARLRRRVRPIRIPAQIDRSAALKEFWLPARASGARRAAA